MTPKIIFVHDLMQQHFCYVRTEPEGKNFHPGFIVDLTPEQMLKLGVFGGKYLSDCTDEFPDRWFDGVRFSHEFHNPALNFFGVNASKTLQYWQQHHWIYPDDPRGWFQWYCRYYMGRRSEDDLRQIARHKAFVRHQAQLQKACPPQDWDCRRVQRQALLHWGYDSRKM